MRLKSWKLWGAITSLGAAAAVNLATDSKYNVAVWAVALSLALLAFLFEFIADQDKESMRNDRETPPALLAFTWEESNGHARRVVSTTSEKVATEFLKRVPPPLSPPHEPSKPRPRQP